MLLLVEEDKEVALPEPTTTEPTELTQPEVEEAKPIEIEDKEIKAPEQEEEINKLNETFTGIDTYTEKYNEIVQGDLEFLKEQQKARQHRIDLNDKIYYHYDKDGNLKGIYNRTQIEDVYVRPVTQKLSFKEYKKKII